jgi:hypothetical protein
MFCKEFKHTISNSDPVAMTRDQRERLTEHYRQCPGCGAWFDLEVLAVPDEVADAYVTDPELAAVVRADREARNKR